MLLIILICLVATRVTCDSTIGNFISQQIDKINNETSKNEIQLLTPSLDIKLYKPHNLPKDDIKNVKIIKNSENHIFLMSHNEIILLEVDSKRHFVNRILIGALSDLNEVIIDVKIESWTNIFVIVVLTDENLHVFHTRKRMSEIETHEDIELSAIQKINSKNTFCKFDLMKNQPNGLFMVTYQIKNETTNELKFFKWRTSFFAEESKEIIDLSNNSEMFIFNNGDEKLIILESFEGDRRVVVFQLDVVNNMFTKLQNMFLKQDHVHHYIINDNLYLIACTTEAFCAVYKWTNSQFRRHRKLSSHVLESVKDIKSRHGIVLVEDSSNQISFYVREDDVVSSEPGLIVNKTMTDYDIFSTDSDEELFFVNFNYTDDHELIIKFHQIEISPSATEPRTMKIEDPVDCVGNLKFNMKNRFINVDKSKNLADLLRENHNKFDIRSKKFIESQTLRIKNSTISMVKMPIKMKSNVREIMEKSSQTSNSVELALKELDVYMNSQQQGTLRAELEQSPPLNDLTIENLFFEGINSPFNELIFNTQREIVLKNDTKIANITANKITASLNEINKIPFDEITKVGEKIVGLKKTTKAKISSLHIREFLNKIPMELLLKDNSTLQSTTKMLGTIEVNNLQVETINDINFDKFMKDVYVTDQKNSINGNLIFSNAVNVNELRLNRLMNTPIDDFMTTKTDQSIQAEISINKFYARNVESGMLNGENIQENFALIEEPNRIHVPTEITTINVRENLQLEDDGTSGERDASSLNSIRSHIIGTHTSDLSQIYNSQVYIQGTLTIKDLSLLSPNTRITVNGVRIPNNISSSYWSLKTKQEIGVDQFTIDNSVKAGSVVTNNLNGHPIKDFVMLDWNLPQGPVDLLFKQSLVDGEIRGLIGNKPSLVYTLNETAVPRRGPPTVIHSSLDFQNGVTVRNLGCGFINEIPADDFYHTNLEEFSFNGKIIEDLQANQIEVLKSLEVENGNGVNINDLPSNAVRIDEPFEIESLKIEEFLANELKVENFENYKMNEFLSSLSNEFSGGRDSSTNRRVKIRGNCKFAQNVFVKSLNGPENNVNNFLNLLALQNRNDQIGGIKTFSTLSIDNLNVNEINKFSMHELLENSLSNGKKQSFKETVFVDNMKVKKLYTNILNSIPFDKFVGSSKSAHLHSNLRVKKLTVGRLSSRSSSYNVGELVTLMNRPKRLYWPTITAEHEAKMPINYQSYLDHLIHYAVLRNKNVPQLINGKVKFTGERIFVNHLIKDDYVVIANEQPVDVGNLIYDSLKNESSLPQNIHGIKTFINNVYFNNAKIVRIFMSDYINDVNIKQLNNSIYRPNDMITGGKRFKNLQVENVYFDGYLRGIRVDDFIAFHPNAPKFSTPRIHFENLHTRDFNTKNIFLQQFNNSINYHAFLRDRVTANSYHEQVIAGPIEFLTLEVLNDTTVGYLNDVNINDVATKTSHKEQIVHGRLRLLGELNIESDSDIKNLNGQDLDNFLNTCVERHKDYQIPYLRTKSLNLTNGLIVRNTIGNHISLQTLNHKTPKLVDLMSSMSHVRRSIDDLSNYSTARSSRRRMYIDFDRDIQISQNLESTQVNDKCRNQQQQIVQPIKHNEILVRQKRGGLEMKVNLPSAIIELHSYSTCENDLESLQIQWKFKLGNEMNTTYFQNLSLSVNIADVKFMESKIGDILMILTTKNYKVIVEKLEKEIFELQKIEDLHEITKLALIEGLEDQFLAISSFGSESSSEHLLKILILSQNQTKFTEIQQQIPSEKFDIILPIYVDKMTFLLLAKTRRKDLYIYRLHDDSKKFEFLHKTTFDDGIKEIVALYTQDDSPSFIVSIQSGHFCNFEWRGIESWKSTQCGFFKKISNMNPYQHQKRNHLYISNAENDGTALTLFRQGDKIH